MIVVPAATPVTAPVPAPIDAMPELLLLHVPPATVLLRLVKEPAQTSSVPNTGESVGLTVTTMVVIQLPVSA